MTGASDMHTLTLKFLNKCLGQKSQMEKKKITFETQYIAYHMNIHFQ